MSTQFVNSFECHLYVSPKAITALLPTETGPQLVAHFEPMSHDKLVDPGFRRLLAAFETVRKSPQSLKTVQV